jgi:hypothetical protein
VSFVCEDVDELAHNGYALRAVEAGTIPLRPVNSIPRAVWNSLTDTQQRIMRFPVAEA